MEGTIGAFRRTSWVFNTQKQHRITAGYLPAHSEMGRFCQRRGDPTIEDPAPGRLRS